MNEAEVLQPKHGVLLWPGIGPAKFICTDDDGRDIDPNCPLQTNRGTAAYILSTFLKITNSFSRTEIRIADIMCGAGGFLQGALEYLKPLAVTATLYGYETNSATHQAAVERFSSNNASRHSIEILPQSVTADISNGTARVFDLVFFSPPQPNLLGKPDSLQNALLRKGMARWKTAMSQIFEASYIVAQEMLAIDLTDCYDRYGRYVDVSGEAIVLAQNAGFALRQKTLNARTHSGLSYNDTSTILFFTPE